MLTALLFAPALLHCAAPQEEDAVDTGAGEDALTSLAAKPADRATLPGNYDSLPGVQKQQLLAKMIATGRYCSDHESQSSCLAKLPKGGFAYYLRAIPALLSLHPTSPAVCSPG